MHSTPNARYGKAGPQGRGELAGVSVGSPRMADRLVKSLPALES